MKNGTVLRFIINQKGPFDILGSSRKKENGVSIFIVASSFSHDTDTETGKVFRIWPEYDKFVNGFGAFEKTLVVKHDQNTGYLSFNKLNIGNLTPSAVFVSADKTLVSFKGVSNTEVYIFDNIIKYTDDSEISTDFLHLLKILEPISRYTKSHTDTEIKIR